MKFTVIELFGEEKVIYCGIPKKNTLGELFQGHENDIKDIQINNKFINDWQNHSFKSDDDIKIFCKTKDFGISAIISIALSVLSSALQILLKPKPKKPSLNKSQPAIGVAGIQNTISPGTPKFISYGTRRVFGHLIASKVDLVESVGIANSGKRMEFSALYYMGVGPIQNITETKINGTHICDIYGPPKTETRLGTSDQTVIPQHEFVHQVYGDGRDLEIPIRSGKSKRILGREGIPVTYTTKSSEINKLTLFISFPAGLFTIGVHGKFYSGAYTLKLKYKKNTDNDISWVSVDTDIVGKTQDGFFYEKELEFPSADRWDVKISIQALGHGSFRTGPTATLFNVMETIYKTTSYPGSALLEVHGIASSQITSFDGMETSALVNGRLVEVFSNGVYSRQFSRNRVWITRDLLFDKTVGLGNRLSSTLWDNDTGLRAANYYEELVLDYNDTPEQRDYCDITIGESAPGWDHIKHLLFEGRAIIIPSNGKFKYLLDIDKKPEMLYSFPNNIIEDTLQLETGSSEKPINTIRAEYPDIEIDYKVVPAKLTTLDIGSDPERPENLSVSSIVRKSQVSRLMNSRLSELTSVKKRWSWRSPKTGIVSEPLDVAFLSYNVSKNLRGYNGFIKGQASTTSSIYTDRSIYLASGFTYSIHVRHLYDIEEKTINNTLGATYSIINLSSPLSFTPENGDAWAIGKTSNQIYKVQIDETDFDGESFILRAHEHIPDIYTDVLSDITTGENITPLTSVPRPLLKAQAQTLVLSGITTTQFNVAPAFDRLVGTYNVIGTNTVVLESKEVTVDDWFNDAYIKADTDIVKVLDYLGSSRLITVASPGFLTASTVSGEYSTFWPASPPHYGFTVEGSTQSTSGPWNTLKSHAGTSFSLINAYVNPNKLGYALSSTITVSVNNNRSNRNKTDYIALLEENQLVSTVISSRRKYLNNSTSYPASALIAGTVTFTSPTTTGFFKINFYPNDSETENSLLESAKIYSGESITSYPYFRFTPYSSNGTENTNGRWVTGLGITDTTIPTGPFTVNISVQDDQNILVDNVINSPLDRDTESIETSIYSGSLFGTALTSSIITDVSKFRNELDSNPILQQISFDLSELSSGPTIFSKVATIDFFGNKSNYAATFTGVTLSGSEIDILQNIFITEDTTSTNFTGSTIHTLYSTTLSGGVLGQFNSAELDLQCLVVAASTQSTYLEFTYKYGGVTAATITSFIANNTTKILDNTDLWLNWFLQPTLGNSQLQTSTAKKWGVETSGSIFTTVISTISVNSDLGQTLQILMTINGNTNSIITRKHVKIDQFIP